MASIKLNRRRAQRQFREPTKTALLDKWYRKQLRQVAKAVGLIAEQYQGETDPLALAAGITRDLFGYSQTLDAWANRVAGIMVRRASEADYQTWLSVGEQMSRETRRKLKSAGVGDTFKTLQAEQVALIKSLPLEAAQKVHEWAQKALEDGERPATFRDRIRTELRPMTESHAQLTARTETARARSNCTQVRAQAVGSDSYIWKTVGDGSVRPRHAELDGTVHRWDDPPVTDYGKGGAPIRSHPGCCFNCRCYAVPLFPERFYGKDKKVQGR